MTEPTPVPVRERRIPRWSARQTHDLTASTMAVGALLVVGIIALRGNDTALGALVAVLSAATGYLMRGRVESTNNGG